MTCAIILIFLGLLEEGFFFFFNGLDTKHYLSLIFMCYCIVQC